MTATPRANLLKRLWGRYLVVLREHPIRTKMITSGSLYVVGDNIAQFGIEGRSLVSTEDDRERYDPWRTARLTIYGGVIFAPLAHNWLAILERLKLQSKITTLAARLTCDSLLWSPFVCALFPSSLGLLEGKTLPEVERKVKHVRASTTTMLWFSLIRQSWLPTWQKAVAVFGPTQVVNLTLVPTQHRLLVLQSVGLCWNIFLSYQNNWNNKLLAAANDALLHADTAQEALIAREKIEELEKKKKNIREGEGGGAVGVATRLSWS